MNVSGRLFLISAVPIPANSTSPAQIFISGRWISNTDLVRFSALLRLSIRLSPYRDDLQTTLETETLNSVTLDKPFTFLNLNQQTIGGIYLVNDINQKPAFVLTFDQPRTLYRTGQILFIYMLIALVSTTLIFAIITILLIDRAFVSRLLHLNSQVKEIGSSHDISQRVSTRGNDEISGLGREINQMLSKLQINQRRLVEIQEEERRHVALELHDEIGQMLTGLKILLETLPNLDKEKALDRHKQALEHSNELIQRVRSLSLDLRPALLDDLGLIPALEWLFTRLSQQANLKIEFRHDHLAGVRFAPSLEITGYRLVQEALTNIVRHSGVSQASVQLWQTRDLLVIQVEDQGKGFIPAEEINGGKSSGLQGMRERVALLGGRLTIDSSPNQGVLLLAELPLNQGD
jgi:signal transduction histidine kinase